MNFINTGVIRSLTIIDNKNIIHNKGSDIVNIDIFNNTNNLKFNTVLKVFELLNDFNNSESIVFEYIHDAIITANDKGLGINYVILDTDVIRKLSKFKNISDRTIYNAINTLKIKKVIFQSSDKSTYYKLNKNYDLTEYFYSDNLSYITIKI